MKQNHCKRCLCGGAYVCLANMYIKMVVMMMMMKKEKTLFANTYYEFLCCFFHFLLFSFANLSMNGAFFLVHEQLCSMLSEQQFPPAGVHRLQSIASAASYLSKVKCTFAFHAYKSCNSPYLAFFLTFFHTHTYTHANTPLASPIPASRYYTECDNKSHNEQHSSAKSTHILICIEIFHCTNYTDKSKIGLTLMSASKFQYKDREEE